MNLWQWRHRRSMQRRILNPFSHGSASERTSPHSWSFRLLRLRVRWWRSSEMLLRVVRQKVTFVSTVLTASIIRTIIALMMETRSVYETLVPFYQTTRSNIAEDCHVYCIQSPWKFMLAREHLTSSFFITFRTWSWRRVLIGGKFGKRPLTLWISRSTCST